MQDLCLRKLFCNFLSSSLIITIARSDDVLESQHYVAVRKSVVQFRSLVQEQLDSLEGDAKADLMRKYSSMLAFDFEAAARLKSWESMELTIKECEACQDQKVFGVLADIALSSEAPADGNYTNVDML
ncbi:MAG: hypothetical protein LQ351_001778 [Letrouitia transgressa]|nr:MAG: hypothetical protein LQ351_001778 [Letrouitia transgressa]